MPQIDGFTFHIEQRSKRHGECDNCYKQYSMTLSKMDINGSMYADEPKNFGTKREVRAYVESFIDQLKEN